MQRLAGARRSGFAGATLRNEIESSISPPRASSTSTRKQTMLGAFFAIDELAR